MTDLAFLFPGQGSQYVGMGKSVLEGFESAREVFRMAEDLCGISVTRLCLEGPMDELTRTENLQPCVTALNLAIWKVLLEKGFSPKVCLGHSLGEYSALACGGVLSLEDTLKAVKKRGELMEREAKRNPGMMAAAIGVKEEVLAEILGGIDDRVSIANYNSPDQIVISGSSRGVNEAVKRIKEKGGKAVPLKVSGAWHSPLMEGALNEFEDFLNTLHFESPSIPIVFNVTSQEESDPEKIRQLMIRQLVSPVRWMQSILNCFSMGVRRFVEVGPKNVLSNLVKRILPDPSSVEIYNVEDTDGIKMLLERRC